MIIGVEMEVTRWDDMGLSIKFELPDGQAFVLPRKYAEIMETVELVED